MSTPSYIAVAKFYVASVEKFGYPDPETGTPVTSSIKVSLNPVSYKPDDPTSENSVFWQYSPSGGAWLQIQNPELFDRFTVGQEIYLPMILASGVALADLSNALHQLVD